MKKFFLVLVILVVLFGLVAGGLVLYAEHYVQSPGFKEKLCATLSQASGGTVQIGSVSGSMINQIQFGNVQFTRSQTAQQASFSTQKFYLRFNPWALLRRKFEIQGLVLENPEIKVVSSPAQTESSLGPPPTPAVGAAPTEAAPGVPQEQAPSPSSSASTPTPPTPERPHPAAQPAAAKGATLELVLKQAEVRNGKLEATLPDGKVVRLANFNFKADFKDSLDHPNFRGMATCETANLADKLQLSDLRVLFSFADEVLHIESLKAGAFQGTLSGKGQVNLRDKQPFEFAIEGSALDLKAIFARKPDIASSLSGKVDLQAKVRGEVTHPADLTGDGSAQVKNATVSAGLLRWVVLATRMPEMETVQLTQCDTKFTIGERKMTFNPINAISQDLRLTGTGWQSFDNLIDFNFRIALSSRIHTHIPNEIAGAFQKQPDDFFGMDFRVWGSLDQPKEDFAQRIGEDALKSAAKQYIPGGILNEVFDKLSGGTNQPNASPPGTDASSSTNAPPATNAAPSNPNPLDQIKKLF